MQTDALTDRLIGSVLGALDVWSICLGDRLGLYRALHDADAGLTAGQLATSAGIDPRYAREWLEHQCVVGLLDVDSPSADPQRRRYRLPAEHVEVLTDVDSVSYLTPLMRVLGAAGAQFPALVEAYRTGGGVSWSRFGPQMRTGQADMNRPWYLSALGSDWLPAVPPLHAALTAGARVADIGCGEGWSSIGMALAYPTATVDGYDLDQASVAAAGRHAQAHGVADRVRFHHGDAAQAGGSYQVVTAFECIHDLPDPVGVLRTIRALAAPDGFVLVMDERVPETFTGNTDDVAERLMYGFSLMVCLPDGMSHPGSVGTGTVMRPDTLRRYATEAGFGDVEVLPIENDLWRFYRLKG